MKSSTVIRKLYDLGSRFEIAAELALAAFIKRIRAR